MELARGGGGEIPVGNFISTRSIFDSLTGRSYCELYTPLSSSPSFIDDNSGGDSTTATLSSMPHLSLKLQVKGKDFDSTYEVLSEWLSVPFLPAFSLDQTNVTLTSLKHSALITVTGLSNVLHSIQVHVQYMYNNNYEIRVHIQCNSSLYDEHHWYQ